MSLATRCTSCGTIFRVVQDQLKVSEGWVRCGRCDEVFNALEGLFDLEREAPPDWTEPAHSVGAVTVESDSRVVAGSLPIDAAQHLSVRSADGETGTAKGIESRLEQVAGDEPEPPIEAPASSGLAQKLEPEPASIVAAASVEAPLPVEVPAPGFVRHAQRQARWRSTPARTALWIAGAALALLLALQAAHHFRDLAASRWPVLRAALTPWCAAVGCVLVAPHRIDDVSVESTALTRGTAADSFRLSVSLRNRGTSPVAMPSVELSLTDLAGQLIARRALNPVDFHASAAALAAGAELPLQTVLSVGTSRVAGYTVEVFYP